MKQRNERETDNCPRWKESETNFHILTIVGAGTDEIFNTAMETVQEWLDKGPKHLAKSICYRCILAKTLGCKYFGGKILGIKLVYHGMA